MILASFPLDEDEVEEQLPDSAEKPKFTNQKHSFPNASLAENRFLQALMEPSVNKPTQGIVTPKSPDPEEEKKQFPPTTTEIIEGKESRRTLTIEPVDDAILGDSKDYLEDPNHINFLETHESRLDMLNLEHIESSNLDES